MLDSSAALAWVLPGESTQAADALLDGVRREGAATPALWPIEIANVLLMVERRGRILPGRRLQAVTLLAGLSIELHAATTRRVWSEISKLADEHHLTVHDATYLELSLRLGLPLATGDRALIAAARAADVALLPTG